MLIKPLALFNRFISGIQFNIIVCHEGLPRSGKSYEAVINQIIPALMKRRKVFARIDGLNHEKFAEVTGLSLQIIQQLLIPIEKDQVKTIYSHVEDDSFVVIDELQDYWSAADRKLSPELTEFVTQHGHRGIDILVMGQCHEDFNVLWKRRIDTLLYTVKRDAVGSYTTYSWISYKQKKVGNIYKFVKVRDGKGTYDPKFFGLYKSHNDGVEAIDTHRDDRVNILKSLAFRFWMPLFAVLLLFAIYYIYGFFHGDVKMVKTSEPVKTVSNPVQPVIQQQPQPQPVQAQQLKAEPPKPPEKPPEPPKPTQEQLNTYKGFLDVYFKSYRPRLAAFIYAKKTATKPERFLADIEFYDEDNRLKDSFSIPQLQELGYKFRKTSLGLIVKPPVGAVEYVVKAWKIELCTAKDGCDRGKHTDEDNKHDKKNS